MNQIADSASSPRAASIDVRSEQVRIIFAAIPSSLMTILIISLGLALVLWSTIDQATLIVWLIATNLLSLLRWHLYLEFKRLPPEGAIDETWYRRAVTTSIASGFTWGAGGFFLFAEQSLVHQVFLAFVIAGMCAGAITTLAAVIEAARGFVVIAILPIIIKFNLANSDFNVAMTLMSTLFVIMLLVSAKRVNQTIVESLEVRHRHELAEHRIRRQAHFDELTELPNRRLMLETLRQETAKAERHRRFGAVFFVDLDRFKSINDSLGHAIGDKLLVRVAKVIAKRLRKEDTFARLGGDEFVVLLPEVGADYETAASHAVSVADQLRRLFETPFLIDGHEIHITISIGIALFPGEASAEDLLKYADVAMYRAKNDGRDSVRLFSAEMQEAVNQQSIIEKGLRQALINNEFELYFQAQYDLDHSVIGAETLLRWNHPEQGVLAPGHFIEVAEVSGLIVPIGEWVLRSACEHLHKIDAGLTLAVNVSPRQFADPNFVWKLKQVLQETGADPRQLKLEITEGLAMANIDHSIETIEELKQLGIGFSMDDFGTGYSSLSYLNRLPVDELKIDKSFVHDICNVSDHAVIVDTIIVMAQKLGLTIVAEGIETADELAYLAERECHRFQGYYFSRPQPFESFLALTAVEPAAANLRA